MAILLAAKSAFMLYPGCSVVSPDAIGAMTGIKFSLIRLLITSLSTSVISPTSPYFPFDKGFAFIKFASFPVIPIAFAP